MGGMRECDSLKGSEGFDRMPKSKASFAMKSNGEKMLLKNLSYKPTNYKKQT